MKGRQTLIHRNSVGGEKDRRGETETERQADRQTDRQTDSLFVGWLFNVPATY